MAKLTHIEDVERRNAEEDEREMLEAQEALQQARQAAAAQAAATQAADQQVAEEEKAGVAQAEETLETLEEAAEGDPVLDVTEEAQKESFDRTAEEEEDFHGLSSDESMGGMQKVLIVLAVIVFVAAILYVVNSWVHFV